MPIYVYETIPDKPGDPVRRYEIQQKMTDKTLEIHPETGERIRRLMIGGVGMPGSISDASADNPDSENSPAKGQSDRNS